MKEKRKVGVIFFFSFQPGISRIFKDPETVQFVTKLQYNTTMRLLNFLLLTCLVAVACASRVGSVGSSLGVPTANTKKKNFHGVVHKFDATPSFVANNVKGATPAAPAPVQLPAAMKLLIGVGGK